MEYYTLGKKISRIYGHNDCGEEIHICPKDAYMGDMSFHPLFENIEDAEEYKQSLKWGYNLIIVKMIVKTK